MNLTVDQPESAGFLRSAGRPGGPETSNVNFGAGHDVPNLVICKLGDGGR